MSKSKLTAAILALGLCLSASADSVSFAQPSSETQQKKLAAVNSVPFWAHDATGYHPALCVRVENLSGSDLTGKIIKMQCRFVDLRLGHVMIARKEQRYELAPNQGVNLIFHGPEAYELPIDQYQWPLVECKLMSRIGDVDDSGTEDLLVQKLESVTMTDDEAVTALSRGFYHHANKRGHVKTQHAERTERPERAERARPEYHKPEEPMSAHALALGAKSGSSPQADSKTALARFAAQTKMPGLGGEFLDFEQMYGHPTAASLKDRGWSWIRYGKSDPSIDVFVGAKGASTKADFVVVKVPAELVQQESQLVALAKSMAGKLRGQALEHPHKSVKYQQLSEQRIRRILVTNLEAPGYRLCYVSPRGSAVDENNYILILSRFTSDVPTMVPELIRRAPMMRFLYSALGLPEQD